MARVTVEDCIEKVPNRFKLVLLSSHRARGLATGANLTLERNNDKNSVVALREIAEETINFDHLKESLITGLQHVLYEPEEEKARHTQTDIIPEMSEEQLLKALRNDRETKTDTSF